MENSHLQRWPGQSLTTLTCCACLQEIIVGRPRDGSDRVTWLLEHSRFEQALNIIESDVTLSQATREQARFELA